MPGEFYFICDVCEDRQTVAAFPRCPKCGLPAMLCEKDMTAHDCAVAKEEKEFYDRHPD
jgi:hypothetical protein